MRRYTLAGFATPGTRQSRAVEVAGAAATLTATRDPLVAADRPAAVVGVGGYLAGISAAIPDVSGGVSVSFEEVYPI